MQAILLAGGKGARLRPYTATFPKPLVPLGDKPILEIVIRQLKKHGFDDIVISTGHLAGLIHSYFKNGEKLGVKIRYVTEEKPLNTAGALSLVDNLRGDFLVMNGDILTDLNYRKMFDFHLEKKAAATIGVHERVQNIDFGVIEMGNDSLLQGYSEKPKMPLLVSMGINILNRKSVSHIKKNEPVGMPDLLLRLKENGEKVYCFRDECRWLDIGRPDDYELAQKEILSHPERYYHE